MVDTWALWYVFLVSHSTYINQISFSQFTLPAVDVNIYGSAHIVSLSGNHENTEIGEFIRDYLELDLKNITRKLLEKGTQFDTLTTSNEVVSWMGKLTEQGGREMEESDIYHGKLRMHQH
jgi:alkaline phosphatase